MTTIYDPIDTASGVAQAPDTAKFTTDGPVAWRVSWSYWLGYAAKTRKSKPEHRDIATREEADAHKADLIRRYTAITACISPLHIAAPMREREFAARQVKIPGATSWPPQAAKTGGGS